MYRAQILIEEWHFDTLKSEAERTGKSVSELVREILTDRYRPKRRRSRLPVITGIVADPQTQGESHDMYLYGPKKR